MADLQKLQAERERIAKNLRATTQNLESLSQARKRLNSMIDRLVKGGPSDAEKKLLDLLRNDRDALTAKVNAAKAARKKRTTNLQRVKRAIARIKHRLTTKQVTMLDTIDLGQMIDGFKAYLGYVSGFWPTYDDLVKRYGSSVPHDHLVSCAVSPNVPAADEADCETGDFTVDQLVDWMDARIKNGAKPKGYASISNWSAIDAKMKARGHQPGTDYKRHTAHYTGQSHRCTAACGFGFEGTADATQFTDTYQGRNLDASLCAESYF